MMFIMVFGGANGKVVGNKVDKLMFVGFIRW